MGFRIGIDAGSKTIKVVVLDEEGKIVHSIYRRHRAAIKNTLVEVLHEMNWRFGNISGPVAITGSAGIAVADLLGLPFIQEVSATTKAIETTFPQAKAIIELGGEDAKVVYLGERLEQRMNASCAGGTGGFIDTIAFMLGVRTGEMNNLAMAANHIYPIASRCAVFAQTDVRPLLNSGAKKSDIAASTFEAVVRQAVGGLACGRAIEGPVAFLGGPLQYNPELVRRFKVALGLDDTMVIKPADAHLYTAMGAALHAGECQGNVMAFSVLERRIEKSPNPEDDLEHLPKLFNDVTDFSSFKTRHSKEVMPRANVTRYEGDAYLGIDAGSTTVKLALLTTEGELLYSDYKPTSGDALGTAATMLGNMYRRIPKYYGSKKPMIRIVNSCVTGYGEDLLCAALKIDGGTVETMAHVRAAQAFRPDVSFVLDIGGQDMKALWVKDGHVTDAVLNEACSSGCGSFIEGTAYSLQSRPERFAKQALDSENPIDLGTKCTVFMTSKVRHAQKIGAPIEDIAAGIAYSVVQNALYRIIGRDKLRTMGDVIVVQGGAFKSDAVLRAFELISNADVIRPDTAHLMGAIGCAFMAMDRTRMAMELSGATETPESAILDEAHCRALDPKTNRRTCEGCTNCCSLSVVDFGDGRTYVSGNKCERAYQYVEGALHRASGESNPPDATKVQQQLMAAFADKPAQGPRAAARLGIMNTLRQWETMPFWHTLATELGFSVLVPKRSRSEKARVKASESIPSESVCQAAKLSHERLYDLVSAGAQCVLMPEFARFRSCAVSCQYASALADAAPIIRRGEVTLLKPVLQHRKPKTIADTPEDRQALLDALNQALDAAGVKAPISEAELLAAMEAGCQAQQRYYDDLEKANHQAVQWAHQEPGRFGIVLAGRPYHMDPQLLHGIGDALTTLGVAVLSAEGIRRSGGMGSEEWPHAKHLMGIGAYVAQDPNLEVVCLESFGCVYDAVSLELFQDALERADRPFTRLKIDDIADVAHIRIRLRTLVESLQIRGAHQQLEAFEPYVDYVNMVREKDDFVALPVAERAGLGASFVFPSSRMGRKHENLQLDTFNDYTRELLQLKVMRQGMGASDNALSDAFRLNPENMSLVSTLHHVPVSQAVQERDDAVWKKFHESPFRNEITPPEPPAPAGVVPLREEVVEALATPIQREDWEFARTCVSSDLCSTAAAILARCILRAGSDEDVQKVVVPKVCQGCVMDSIPLLLDRACDRHVDVEWVEPEDVFGSPEPEPADDRICIGVAGNPFLVNTKFMNDHIVKRLKQLGCRVVLSTCDLTTCDDVRYFQQMESFVAQGVEHVIYLQSFGCLKGHVQARGALHQFEERFGGMPVTVIDCDMEASALNRENRVRLAVEAARRNRPDAPATPQPKPSTYRWMGSMEDQALEGSSLLASGVDPAEGDDPRVALSYLLEEGSYFGREFGGVEELGNQMLEDLESIDAQLEELTRQAKILRQARKAME